MTVHPSNNTTTELRYIKLFEEFINEGGWSTTKTQGTTITPKVIAEVVKILDGISKGFNSHLASIDLPSLDFMKPIGSGTWWKEDVENNPDKTYGDVDYLLAYPTLKLTEKGERENEIATVKLYNSELMTWLSKAKIKEVDLEESKKVSSDTALKLIVTFPIGDTDGYVQVDLVVTHKDYSAWSVFRLTPIRNVKGFVLGNLYSSFGEVLDISIQPRGVRAKFEGEIMQPYSKRANVEERVISADAKTFMDDIAKFFWFQSQGAEGKPYEPAPSLKNWRGVDPNNPKMEDFCQGIRGVAETLEKLGEFGTTLKYKSASEFLKAVIDQYEKKMMKQYNDSKFNKAESPEAKATVEKIRKMITEYVSKAKSLL